MIFCRIIQKTLRISFQKYLFEVWRCSYYKIKLIKHVCTGIKLRLKNGAKYLVKNGRPGKPLCN